METVLLSVIVPVYNAQDYLKNLLSDIQKQQNTNFEVILIDDGSIDGSRDICEEYVKNDSRFHYSYQQNQGVSAARNNGIKKAKGEYIIFLDSDDRIPQNCFKKFLEPFETKNDLDLVIGKYQSIGDVQTDRELYCQSALSGKKKYEDMVWDCISLAISFYYGAVWNKVYRKDIIDSNQIWFDESLQWCEDFIFNINYFQHVRFCYYLNESIYYYCYRSDSTLSREGIIDDRLDFVRYRYLSCLKEEIEGNLAKEKYQKKVDMFLIDRIHGILSDKAKKWKILDKSGYAQLKKYLLTEESVFVWKQKSIFINLSVAEKIVWILMKIKLFYLIYLYYIIKNRAKVMMNRQKK